MSTRVPWSLWTVSCLPLASQSAQYLLSSSRSSLVRMAWCCSFSFWAFSLSDRVVISLSAVGRWVQLGGEPWESSVPVNEGGTSSWWSRAALNSPVSHQPASGGRLDGCWGIIPAAFRTVGIYSVTPDSQTQIKAGRKVRRRITTSIDSGGENKTKKKSRFRPNKNNSETLRWISEN